MEDKIKAIEDAIWTDAEAMAREIVINDNGMYDLTGYNVEEGLNPIATTAYDYAQGMFSAIQKVRKAFDLPEIDRLEALYIPDHLRAEFPDGWFD